MSASTLFMLFLIYMHVFSQRSPLILNYFGLYSNVNCDRPRIITVHWFFSSGRYNDNYYHTSLQIITRMASLQVVIINIDVLTLVFSFWQISYCQNQSKSIQGKCISVTAIILSSVIKFVVLNHVLSLSSLKAEIHVPV